MKALILSGGTGTRLRPLTYSNAKQLLPLANKPILFYIIEKIIKAGIREIGIIVGDTHEEVKKAVGDGERWGVKIDYIHQPRALGLAHAVKMAGEFLGDNDFVMILGDNVFNMDLHVLINNFYSNQANTTILLHRVDNPSQYGVAVVKGGCITELVEKPKEYISDLIITGVYVFDKSIFPAIEQTPPSDRGEYEITDAIQKQLQMGGKVTYELVRGWWKDTGKLEDMLEANRLILDELESEYTISDYPGSSISGKVVIGENVVIKDSIIQGPVHIDQDAEIINSCIGPYTSLGKRVKVEKCELDNCIVLNGTKLIGINKRISKSLIGKNVSIIGGINKIPLMSSFFVGDDSQIKL
ncbi:MAG TPA: glucose-1-phosphate thymidylyltransferase [Peptococcaceae bacterium]|nr:glucose-1-phosphate thymidylyltransferase [Peptococcaceae bacterium]